jgi:hypothetical protein
VLTIHWSRKKLKAGQPEMQFTVPNPMKWIASAVFCLLIAGGANAAGETGPKPRKVAPGVLQVGRIVHPRITESSGVVVSRKNPEVLWTHVDGGGRKQVLYAMTRSGQPLAEYRVAGVLLDDWEDIAADGQGHLFLADIGNNEAHRQQISVHQIEEPDPAKIKNGLAMVTRTWALHFPGAPFDCESLVVWGDHGYLVSKVFDDMRAGIYRFSLTNQAPSQILEWVGETKIDSPVTGADISPDGRLLGLVAKSGAFVYRIDGDVARATRGKPFETKFRHEHIEGCTFVPEGLLATAESREIFLFTDEAFRTGPPLSEKKKK